jgi:phage terminase large subunit-like protein
MRKYVCTAQRPKWAVDGDGIDKAGLARAQRVIEFIELLNVPSGEGQGKPIRLRDWQKQFIIDVYAPSTKGRRRVRRAIFSVARKNGKTALIAALVICHLVGPEAIQNGEIYSAATDREQAGQVFKFCRQIIDMDPELAAIITVVPSTKTLVCKHNGSFYRAMSAEAGTKHGLNPSLWIYDELAQARDQELYEVMNTSQGAREEPLGIVISTQSPDPEHPLSKLIDDGLVANDPNILVHLYAVPDEVVDVFDPEVWHYANPALGDFRSIVDLQALADQAQRMPSLENAFRNLYANQKVDIHSPLVARSEWKACQTGRTIEPGEEIYLGLDLSSTNDLTALVAVSAERGEDRVKAWHWKPLELLADHAKRDNFDYVTHASERGGRWLSTTPGRLIDYEHVAEHLAWVHANYKIKGLAYDRARMDDLKKEMRLAGLYFYDAKEEPIYGAIRLIDWGQGWVSMSPAIDALERSVISRRFQHDGNPVLGFCFANATVIMDPAGNRKLDKSANRFRIDGAVATAMALGLKYRDLSEEPVPATSPWDDPDFSLVAA